MADFNIQQPVQPGPVEIGAAAQPLVTSAAPVVTPDAVTALTDAFHKGFISSQDIADRIGQLGQLERKTQMQKMSEFIDPDAIAARKAAVAAGGAQSNLSLAMANAQLPLVGQKAALDSATIAKQNADLYQKPALDAYSQWGNPPIYFLDAEGNPTNEIDTQQMAAAGTHLLRAQNWMQIAQQNLVGEIKNIKDPKTGQDKWVYVNKLNQDVSPGTPAHEYWTKEFANALKELHEAPSITPRMKTAAMAAAEPNTDETAAPVVQPAYTPPAGSEYAKAAQSLVMPASEQIRNSLGAGHLVPQPGDIPTDALNRMTPAELEAEWRKRQVAAPASAPPVVTPAVAATQPVVSMGVPTGPEPGTTPNEIQTAALAHPSVTSYLDKVPAIDAFNRIVGSYDQIDKSGEPSTQADLNLANEAAQLASLAKTGRGIDASLRAASLEEKVPRIEQLLDIKKLALRENAFPKETRERIIAQTRNIISGWEGPASSVIKQAVARGVPPERFLGPERNLLNAAPSPAATPAAPAGRTPKVVTGPTGAKYILGW